MPVDEHRNHRPPLSPREGWISDGRQVLHFQPTGWDRSSQRLTVTVGELLPNEQLPLREPLVVLSREEALKLWNEKRRKGWRPTTARWQPPAIPAQG